MTVQTPAQFYAQALPLAEQLNAMAREWRRTASPEALPAAIEAHGELLALAIRFERRLAEARSKRGR